MRQLVLSAKLSILFVYRKHVDLKIEKACALSAKLSTLFVYRKHVELPKKCHHRCILEEEFLNISY